MKLFEMSTHDGDRFFAGSRVAEAWAEARNPRSRYTICYMSPADFISVAEPGFDREKAERVQQFLNNAEPFPALPFIGIDETGRVIAHEGRHRTRALHTLGVQQMPVVVRSSIVRWGEDQSHLPQQMLPQTSVGRAIPMPQSAIYPRQRVAEAAVEPISPTQLSPIYYHGTARSNLAFRPKTVAYFTDQYTGACDHARMDTEHEGGTPFVIEVSLAVRNPVMIDTSLMQDLHFRTAEREELRRQGYDAAIGPESPHEVCVLDPRCIRVRRIIPISLNEAQDPQVQSLLQGVKLTSFQEFMDSLRWVPREQVQALQQILDRLKAETQRPGPGWIQLWHGAPNKIADLIHAGGFQLTQGQRANPFMGGFNYPVQNLGIFLTDNKNHADYFGSNRADPEHDYRVLSCFVDVSNVVDISQISKDVIRMGRDFLNSEYGTKPRRQIKQEDWWELFDNPQIIQELRAHYTGVRFPESKAIFRAAAARFNNPVPGPSYTYMIFDPSTIRVANRDTISGLKSFYEWLRKQASLT